MVAHCHCNIKFGREIVLEILKKYRRKIIMYGIIGFIGCIFIIQFPYWIGESKAII